MDQSTWPPADWLESLDAPLREKAKLLVERFRSLGATGAEEWAASEISEDIPQLARFLVLRHLWRDCIDVWRDSPYWIPEQITEAEKDPTDFFGDAGLALKRLRDVGVNMEDVRAVARFVAFATTFDVLNTIDGGGSTEAPDDTPGWTLIETSATGEVTGRRVGGLHESLLSLDPSGREGRPG